MKDKASKPEPTVVRYAGCTITQHGPGKVVIIERDGVSTKVLPDGVDLSESTAWRFFMAAKKPMGA